MKIKMEIFTDEHTNSNNTDSQKRNEKKKIKKEKKEFLHIDEFESHSEMIDLSSLNKKLKREFWKDNDEAISESVKPKKKKKDYKENSNEDESSSKPKKKKKKHFEENTNDDESSSKLKKKKNKHFEENINDDESSSDDERVSKKIKKVKENNADRERLPLPYETRISREGRTIFVGNVPLTASKEKLRKLFKQFGDIEKVWLRGAAVGEGNIPKKVAIMKKLFSKNQPGLIAYILFVDKSSAVKALKMNGEVFSDHHLRVDLASSKSAKETDMSKSVFLGNLPFNVTDEEIWDMFNECGEIGSVRIVRDSNTGIGKGFGYVNFKNSESIELALKLHDENLNGREIRVKRCIKGKKPKWSKLKKKERKGEKNQKLSTNDDGNKKKTNKYKGKTTSPGSIGNKKTKKVSKGDLEKKVLADKLKAKTKKHEN